MEQVLLALSPEMTASVLEHWASFENFSANAFLARLRLDGETLAINVPTSHLVGSLGQFPAASFVTARSRVSCSIGFGYGFSEPSSACASR